MKDVFGNEIKVGQFVAFTAGGYADLFKGVVVRLTPKMVVIKFATNIDGMIRIENSEHKVYPSQVACSLLTTEVQ